MEALWYLFHDALARREDYATITESTTYPFNFCAARWLEYDIVAQKL